MNRLFAGVQRWGLRLALVLVLGSFAVYLTGLRPAQVPLERLPALLSEGAGALLLQEGMQPGWAWLGRLGYGDLLSLGALLATICVVITGYLALLPHLLLRRDWLYVVLVGLQLLMFAASAGLLSGWRG